MRKTTLYLAIAASLPCLANTYTVPFRDGPFGKYSNYPDGRITEVCIHQVGYLMTDTGHLIVAVDKDEPLYKVKNGENALAFYTRYYQPIPLLLRGYGAGNAVTAAGIFADILRTLKH